jgi:hypothetical protein
MPQKTKNAILWRALATQNVIGPAAYYGFGRRRGR